MYINLTWKCRVCVWVAFLCLLCAFLPSLTTLEWIDQQHFAKTKMGAFFTLKFKCHDRYNKLLLCDSENGDIAWCNKNNSEWEFCVFLKKNKCLFFFKNTKKFALKKTKNRWVVFFFEKKQVFLNPDCLSILFVIFPWSHDLEQDTSLPV